MPRKKSTPRNTFSSSDFKSIFLNPSYTQEEALYARYEAGEIGNLDTIPKLVELGWKISLSFADNHNIFWVTGTYKGKNHPTLKNHCLMSKHSDLDKAYALLEQVIFIEIEDRGNVEFIPSSSDSW